MDGMITVLQTREFDEWLCGLKDGLTRRRLEKAELGNLGDIAPVGEGVIEIREHFGSGYGNSCDVLLRFIV
jgi:putative addiction module killer protein